MIIRWYYIENAKNRAVFAKVYCRRPLTPIVNLEAVLVQADDRPPRDRVVL